MWHTKELGQVFAELSSGKQGLTEEQAERRLEESGYNELRERKGRGIFSIFVEQFKDFFTGVLILATVVSFLLGETVDAYVILIIVFINAVMGLAQEYKAEKAIERLKELSSPSATVLRDRNIRAIPAREVVPGDIIILKAGDFIPADARVCEASYLKVDEASLTGESIPSTKVTETMPDVPLADRENMVYLGTVITDGKGKAVVTATGMNTEMGKIAEEIQAMEVEKTPLQGKLEKFSKYLAAIIGGLCVIIFVLGVLRGVDTFEMFLTAVSLAVAAIPEGLPAIVTIVLALGVQQMIRRNALIRRLKAVEALGSATIICSDKTGTITRNEMMVSQVYSSSTVYVLTGEGYSQEGSFYLQSDSGTRPDPVEPDAQLLLLMRIGALCNDSRITEESIIGDPTEASLIVSAAKVGLYREELEAQYPRVKEIPFSSERKLMTTLHEVDGTFHMYTKGAPDVILDLCTQILEGTTIRKLTQEKKEEILSVYQEMASQALRALAMAYKDMKTLPEDLESAEQDLIFVGIQGMRDDPRTEVKEAISVCQKAGIKSMMITGDYKATAVAVAEDVGITGGALTGQELEQLTDEQLAEVIDGIGVVARVSPEHKTRIVTALKSKGHIVAMTGDGVNDAPSLKKADIGIAMGITGTDVAKEAADMVLMDDNFASIVNAVEEGRHIFDNIIKFIYFLLCCNVGEILVLFLAILLGLSRPLLPIQILWINLITDGFPALALGADPPEEGIMDRSPRNPSESIFARGRGTSIVEMGLVMSVLVLVGFYFSGQGDAHARTLAFSSLVFVQLAHAFNARSEKRSIFSVGLFTNMWLVGAVVLSVSLQIAVVYVPVLQSVFGTSPLHMEDWLIILGLSGVIVAAGELMKKSRGYSGQ
ncbi:MAG: calcium-translocating P-type ATPase, SERCA-type [Theionarchaea archaeon]|nr:calcium-translocating P-type ATPase, SERCA-type [Theionarchaea archaeon]MBU6999244.1 calcium-translocating P-type ATPase, SERCA-type [Theionarchaea archaeon]MBU7019631.1 calcium-translocating P-type ATPase, SERCA-type [Theionarchaea archaeon]